MKRNTVDIPSLSLDHSRRLRIERPIRSILETVVGQRDVADSEGDAEVSTPRSGRRSGAPRGSRQRSLLPPDASAMPAVKGFDPALESPVRVATLR